MTIESREVPKEASAANGHIQRRTRTFARSDVIFAAEAMTFDDVLLVPGYAEVLPADVELSLALHPKLRLNVPVLSAAMATVTEGE